LEAVTADLIESGVRVHWIGTDRFSWADFAAWVAKRPPPSILYQAVHGVHHDPVQRMLGLMIEVLRAGNWQRGGGKGQKPRQIKWAWLLDDDTTSFGTAAPIDDVRDFLMLRNGRAPGGG
jgi:hypothetical protein